MADGIVGLELLAVSRLVVALCEVHAGKLGEIFELVHQSIGTINRLPGFDVPHIAIATTVPGVFPGVLDIGLMLRPLLELVRVCELVEQRLLGPEVGDFYIILGSINHDGIAPPPIELGMLPRGVLLEILQPVIPTSVLGLRSVHQEEWNPAQLLAGLRGERGQSTRTLRLQSFQGFRGDLGGLGLQLLLDGNLHVAHTHVFVLPYGLPIVDGPLRGRLRGCRLLPGSWPH